MSFFLLKNCIGSKNRQSNCFHLYFLIFTDLYVILFVQCSIFKHTYLFLSESHFHNISITNLSESLGDRGSRDRGDIVCSHAVPLILSHFWGKLKKKKKRAILASLISDYFSSNLTAASGLSKFSKHKLSQFEKISDLIFQIFI